jgi:hypothetical protein
LNFIKKIQTANSIQVEACQMAHKHFLAYQTGLSTVYTGARKIGLVLNYVIPLHFL